MRLYRGTIQKWLTVASVINTVNTELSSVTQNKWPRDYRLISLLILNSDSHLSKRLCYLLDWKPLKNDEKCILFCLKSYFRSQDIKVLVMTFWSYRKKGFIRKIRLTSKFMTSQPGLQTIAIHILPNISQSKGNPTM